MAEKAYIKTYGCQMNEHDSYQMRGVLEQQGYEITDDQDAASLIVVNTCSVRHNPENKVYSLVGTLRERKKAEPNLIIAVAGCGRTASTLPPRISTTISAAATSAGVCVATTTVGRRRCWR